MKIRTRIAPSPTGIAHLGTAYTAMRNWALAKQSGGKFLIRIEDTDRERYVEGAVEVILSALKWLGIDHDEGPDIGGPHLPYTQSERLDIYKKHAKELVNLGKAYYCFCSRERLEEVRKKNLENKTLPRYDRHCRTLDPRSAELRVKAQESHVIRLKVPESGVTTCSDVIRGDVSWENSGLDDQVLQKSDGYPTYHLGVVVDDHLMGVTHIIRGEEWLSSSPKHILLYQAFGWELPIFAHLPVIRNKDKSKMSKRKNDVSILSHRDRGYLPEAIMNFMALMGWSHPEKKEIFPVTDFVKYFSLERVTLTAPVYDIDKLNWLNGQYIRALNDKELSSRLIPFIPSDCPKNLVSQLIPLVKERLVTLKDFEELTKFFYRDIEVDHSLLHKKSNPEQVKEQLTESIKIIEKISDSDMTAPRLEQLFRTLASAHTWKPGQFFMMLRIATTGQMATPPLFDTMAVLGRKLVLKRLQFLQ